MPNKDRSRVIDAQQILRSINVTLDTAEPERIAHFFPYGEEHAATAFLAPAGAFVQLLRGCSLRHGKVPHRCVLHPSG